MYYLKSFFYFFFNSIVYYTRQPKRKNYFTHTKHNSDRLLVGQFVLLFSHGLKIDLFYIVWCIPTPSLWSPKQKQFLAVLNNTGINRRHFNLYRIRFNISRSRYKFIRSSLELLPRNWFYRNDVKKTYRQYSGWYRI